MDEATDAGLDMLGRWASRFGDRTTIIEFLEWCEEQGYHLSANGLDRRPCPEGRGALLDRYHEIDQQQLDRDRRELLRRHRR